MKLEKITKDILDFYKNNLPTYLKKEDNNIKLPSLYVEGDINILNNSEVIFYKVFDKIDFNELENVNNIMILNSYIFIVFKLKTNKEQELKTIKQYCNAIYKLINENITLNNIVSYTKLKNIEFYDVDEQNNFKTQIISIEIDYFLEI